jgi:hypothetical protein
VQFATSIEQPVQDAQPAPVARFLRAVSRSGTIAAASVFGALQFWRDSAGLEIPLNHHLCSKFQMHAPGRAVQQALELAPLEFYNMITAAGKVTGTLRVLYFYIILIAICCIRWEHVQRSKPSTETGPVTFHCMQGKKREQGVRPGFDWAVPKLVRNGVGTGEYIRSFWQATVSGSADQDFLVPAVELSAADLYAITSDTPLLVSKPMSRAQFLEIFTGHLVADGVEPEQASVAK